MEPQTLAPAVMAERVNEAGGDRLVKSNILYIDGRNLHQSRILHYHPIGRNEEKADEGLVDDSNVSLLSRYVREILVLLCYSDSRHYARKFGVPVEDYKKRFANYLVSRPRYCVRYLKIARTLAGEARMASRDTICLLKAHIMHFSVDVLRMWFPGKRMSGGVAPNALPDRANNLVRREAPVPLSGRQFV